MFLSFDGLDKHVRAFYEELPRCPVVHTHEFELAERTGLESCRFSPWEADKILRGNNTFARALLGTEIQLAAAFDLLARLEAKEYHVAGLGMVALHRKIPALLYMPGTWGELYGESVPAIRTTPFTKSSLELGIDKDFVESFRLLHHGPSAFDEVDTRVNVPSFIQSNRIAARLGGPIVDLFTGLVYHGADASGKELLYLFIDTSEATREVSDEQVVRRSLAEMLVRYGFDKCFMLSASTTLLTDRLYECSPGLTRVDPSVRMDTADVGTVDLQVIPFAFAQETPAVRSYLADVRRNVWDRHCYQWARAHDWLTWAPDGSGFREYIRLRLSTIDRE